MNWLLSKLRRRRYSVSTGQLNRNKIYFGTIIKMHYSNWKHDPDPLIWVQYSDRKYTHGINLNYLDISNKKWLARSIYMIKKAGQIIDGRTFYKYIKLNRYAVAQQAYRLYFSNMINRPRMVSAGITNLDPLVYDFADPFIKALNKSISSTEISTTQIQLAYSKTELQDRIIQSTHSRPISQQRTGGIQKAAWLRP